MIPVLYVLNPSGEFPNKTWVLAETVTIAPVVDEQENFPTELGKWGTKDKYYGRPKKTVSVTGENLFLEETTDWEKLALKQDRIRVVVQRAGYKMDGSSSSTEQTFEGDLVGFDRRWQRGTILYDVTLQIDCDIPDPDTLTYTGNTITE